VALTAYTGPPGSGKSYALVERVIVPAVMAGRAVLTNLEGVQPDKVEQYCADKGGVGGSVRLFDGYDTLKPGFFPASQEDAASIMRPGDLLVMDEVRMYWPRRGTFPQEIVKFIRFHRHFTAADGTASDLVLASQLATDFHADFRGVSERTFRFKKLSTLGASGRYVFEMWEGHLQPKGGSAVKGQGKYKPEIFDLYKSYSGGAGGLEKLTDNRGNIWKQSKTWFLIGGTFAALAVGGWALWHFLHPATFVAKPAESAAGVAAPPAPVQAAPAPAPVKTELSTRMRIAGDYQIGGAKSVVLEVDGGKLVGDTYGGIIEKDGLPVAGVVDGAVVRTFPEPCRAIVSDSGEEITRPASRAKDLLGFALEQPPLCLCLVRPCDHFEPPPFRVLPKLLALLI